MPPQQHMHHVAIIALGFHVAWRAQRRLPAHTDGSIPEKRRKGFSVVAAAGFIPVLELVMVAFLTTNAEGG
jgi:hypothetical protein